MVLARGRLETRTTSPFVLEQFANKHLKTSAQTKIFGDMY
jgi:hypothetical protein